MTLITFAVLLSILVLVHEFGHFWWAKKFGIKVEEFGIGLPPKIKTLFRKGETEYTLNWLPLGGFVRLLGENEEEVAKKDLDRAFFSKPRWQRTLVLLGGIINNFLFGILLFGVIYSVMGVPRVIGKRVIIVGVEKSSPAGLAGLKEGEVVKKVDGKQVVSVDEFTSLIKAKAGKAVSLEVAQVNEKGEVSDQSELKTVVPRKNPPEGQGALGVVVSELPKLNYEKKPWYQAPFYGLVLGTKEAYEWGKEITISLVQLIEQSLKGKLPAGLSGPVGIYKMTGKAEQAGWLVLLRFSAILSINLAIFNLIPFPALDGGRLLFVWLEKIIKKKYLVKVESWIHTIGFVLLMLLLLIVTWRDLR